jgi:hypothetical protein
MASEASAPRLSFGYPGFSRQAVVVAALMIGALALGLSVAALIVRLSPGSASGTVETAAHFRALPLLPAMAPVPATQAGGGFDQRLAAASPPPDEAIHIASPPERIAPSPLLRPLAPSPQSKLAVLPPKDAPLPPPRPLAFAGPAAPPAGPFDRWTAVYDLAAHTVYMPDGTRLEAHSGLGARRDDPRYVDEKERGATPPHLYDLALREEPFHGVQALRLNPVGGESAIFGRVGLLAHTYMLGPTGESNGCVSFKDYDAFLRAFESGKVKRLAVVASLNDARLLAAN